MSRHNKNFILLDAIDSTNNYANRLISEGTAKNGTVVLAHYQEVGRGQRNNYWESAPGKNLLTSYVAFPGFLEASKQFYLSKITCLALLRLLTDKGIEPSIKWPNDIYAGNRKIAGILIETAVKRDVLDSAVIGVGLNLNQSDFSAEIPNPVSLKMITGSEYDAVETAGLLWAAFGKLYHQLEAGAYKAIDDAYLKNLYRGNRWAFYRKQGARFEGRIAGIGEYGQLLLEDRSGRVTPYMFKEVEFVI